MPRRRRALKLKLPKRAERRRRFARRYRVRTIERISAARAGCRRWISWRSWPAFIRLSYDRLCRNAHRVCLRDAIITSTTASAIMELATAFPAIPESVRKVRTGGGDVATQRLQHRGVRQVSRNTPPWEVSVSGRSIVGPRIPAR